MSKLKIASLVGVIVLAALVGGFYGFIKLKGDKVFGAANAPVNSTFSAAAIAEAYNGTQDVVGTHKDSTTTVGVASPTINVTNTYVSKVGTGLKDVVYQIRITAATTTVNNTSFIVQGSNDALCETVAGNASSTTDVVQKDINWYDAMTYLANRVHPTSFGVGSSTAVLTLVNANANTTEVIALKDVPFTCLKFAFSASSTAVYAGLNTFKSN